MARNAPPEKGAGHGGICLGSAGSAAGDLWRLRILAPLVRLDHHRKRYHLRRALRHHR